MKRQTEFTKDFIPKGRQHKKNLFTRNPRLKKRLILRQRDSSQRFLKELEDLEKKLQATDIDPTDPDQ